MSVDVFCRNLPSLPFGKNDRKWFSMWIRRYAGSLKRGKTDTLAVDEPDVIRFLKALRDNGTPAWQRLQAARTVEAYRAAFGVRPCFLFTVLYEIRSSEHRSVAQVSLRGPGRGGE